MIITEKFSQHQKNTKVYNFIFENELIATADAIARIQHQSLASFVRQSVDAAASNYRKHSAS